MNIEEFREYCEILDLVRQSYEIVKAKYTK